MSISQTFTFGHGGGSVALTDTVGVTGSVAAEVNVALAASAADQLVAVGYLTANIKGYYIKSDQDCTIKVDSSGSPEETITVKAGVPVVWCYGQPSACMLLTSDVGVGWYLTNGSSTTAANFYARILN